MDAQKQLLYSPPAVIYEATLVAQAGPSQSVKPFCPMPGGDLLDPSKNP